MKVITIASLKGGVGKTTLSAFLALALSSRGRTLAVDLDANNNLTDFFARDVDDDVIENANAYHLLTKRRPASDCVISCGLFTDLVPGALALHKLTVEMMNRPAALLSVRSLLPTGYDFVVIDTAPSLEWSTIAGLFAADVVLSPVNLSRWTMQAVNLLQERIENIPNTPALSLVPSIVTKAEREALSDFEGVTKTAIHKAAAIRTASNKAQRLKESHAAFLEFEALADELTRGK